MGGSCSIPSRGESVMVTSYIVPYYNSLVIN